MRWALTRLYGWLHRLGRPYRTARRLGQPYPVRLAAALARATDATSHVLARMEARS